MELKNRQDLLLTVFVLLSLLLHLLLLALVPEMSLFPASPRKEPLLVEVRPPRTMPEARERELDLPPVPSPEKPRERPAKRLGPADQVVERETAPAGESPEDRAPAAVAAPAPAPAPPKVVAPSEQPPSTAPAPARRSAEAPPMPPPAPEPAVPAAPRDLPDLRTLTRLTPRTIARLEDEWRTKYRADVEKGDAVWLDTEKDILISFFQRFRNNIYNVWNYPPRSAERGEEGTCLLKITISRDGRVEKVQLMETSGYRPLDEEAVAAVKKGAPYGPLPRAYEGEELNIFAFFKYNLTNRIIY